MSWHIASLLASCILPPAPGYRHDPGLGSGMNLQCLTARRARPRSTAVAAAAINHTPKVTHVLLLLMLYIFWVGRRPLRKPAWSHIPPGVLLSREQNLTANHSPTQPHIRPDHSVNPISSFCLPFFCLLWISEFSMLPW